MSNVIPENYFLSEVHDPQYTNISRIEKMIADDDAIVRYDSQKDGAVWLKVYKKRDCPVNPNYAFVEVAQ